MPNIGYGDWYTAIHFRCNNEMPMLIYNACVATGTISNTRYIQEAVCAALARDLDMDEEELLAMLPPSRTRAAHLFHPKDLSQYQSRVGSSGTHENVV